MEKIKIAEFVSRLQFGGVESMILNYISNFKNKDKFEIHIITQDINEENCINQFKNAGIEVHVITHKKKNILKNIIEVSRILKKEKFDIVHSHMTLTNFYILFLAKIYGVKVRISHAHSAFLEDNIIRKVVFKSLKIMNVLFATHLMACGYIAGNFLYGKKRMENKEVIILNNAIDISKFKYNTSTRTKIKTKYNMQNEICIGHIGRFTDVKNHKFLLDVFQEIKKINYNSKLLLIGDGERHSNIENLVQKKGLSQSVVFTGNINNTNEFYQAMDVFVLPSLYEGLPVVMIEAQANGLPCLVSDNIDKNSAISDNVYFMNLKKPAILWAKTILKLAKSSRNKDSIALLSKQGYNIKIEASRLEKLYQLLAQK